MFKTLREWNDLGFKVKKGSKHVGWNVGVAVFDETQVTPYDGKRKQIYKETRDWDIEWEAEIDELTSAEHNYGWGND